MMLRIKRFIEEIFLNKMLSDTHSFALIRPNSGLCLSQDYSLSHDSDDKTKSDHIRTLMTYESEIRLCLL